MNEKYKIKTGDEIRLFYHGGGKWSAQVFPKETGGTILLASLYFHSKKLPELLDNLKTYYDDFSEEI